MKRYTYWIFLLVMGFCSAQADQLSFVTVMSAPMGSFNQVETAANATAGTVTLHRVNSVTLKGTESANLGEVVLNGNASLEGTVSQFKTTWLQVAKDGEIQGGSLTANTMYLNTPTKAKVSDTLSGSITANFAGADNLYVNQTDSWIVLDPGQAIGKVEWKLKGFSGEYLLEGKDPVRKLCVTKYEYHERTNADYTGTCDTGCDWYNKKDGYEGMQCGPREDIGPIATGVRWDNTAEYPCSMVGYGIYYLVGKFAGSSLEARGYKDGWVCVKCAYTDDEDDCVSGVPVKESGSLVKKLNFLVH